MTTLFGQSWPAPESGGTQDLTGTTDSSHYAMGIHFKPAVAGTVDGLWYWIASGFRPANADFGIGLYRVVGGITGTVTNLHWEAADPSTPALGSWHLYPFSSAVAVSAGDELYAVVRTNHYGFSQHVFGTTAKTSADGNLTAAVNSAAYPNGGFIADGTRDFATPPTIDGNFGSFNESFYGIDPEFTAAGAPPASTERWGIPL